MTPGQAIGRALRLRCPRCGSGRLFRGFVAMAERCTGCALDLMPEQGYYVGALYVNYALTAGIVLAAGLLLLDRYPIGTVAWPLGAFAVLFPLAIHRWAKSLWLALDLILSGQSREP